MAFKRHLKVSEISVGLSGLNTGQTRMKIYKIDDSNKDKVQSLENRAWWKSENLLGFQCKVIFKLRFFPLLQTSK